MKKLLSILLFTPIIIFAQQSEDVVYLKAGSIIRGLIIEQVQNSYKKVQSGQNVFVYQIDEIEKMTKEILQDKTLSNNPIGGGSSFSFTKGMKSISGNVSYYNFFYDGKDMGTSLTIAPSIGYFLNDNFSANIGLNFTSNNNDDSSSSNNAISIGGKFHSPLSFGIGYFGLNIYIFKRKYESDVYDDLDSSSEAFSIIIGTLHGLNDFVYLDYGIKYLKGIGDNKRDVLSFNGGISTFIK
jgi:hypothetical protein